MNSLQRSDRVWLLSPEFHERVWGSHELEPLFRNSAGKIGEVWFPESDSDILVKFLFTTENLSIQVHPNDQLAQASGHARGKTEMWHVLSATASARIAIGFEGHPTLDQVRRAALDGSIMGMLRWVPARAGDSWFIPAGAVHALSGGISLCEVQQNSDVTYRLFDYGRDRTLHLEESIRALDLDFEPRFPVPGERVLADCPFFRVERISVSGAFELNSLDLIIAIDGAGALNELPFTQGNVARLAEDEIVRVSGNLQILTVVTRT